MPAITLSPAFFRNELRAYSNWRTAFWRELIQNSVDAKASTIWIDFEETDHPPASHHTAQNTANGTGSASASKDLKITFQDDGPGMDRSTLEQTYFVVGETTKLTSGTEHSIGGFGRARIITCFAHKRFEIHTQSWLCEGSGTEYTIQEAYESQEGCDIKVTISPDLASMDSMEQALRTYLKTCQLNTVIYIRGTRFKEWTHKNRLAGQLPFGKIYLNKSKCSDGVLIRVNGVQMFTRYSAATWQIVLEIDAAQSRQVLTSNRDGLTGDAADQLDRFIGRIWVNPASAVRSHYEKTTRIFGNTIYRVNANPNDPNHETQHPTPSAGPHPFNRDNGNTQWEYGDTNRIYGHDTLYARDLTPNNGNGHAPSDKPVSTALPTPCYVHVLDCTTADVARASKSFLPDEIKGIRLKLLQKWTDACAIAVTALAEMEGKSFTFRTGFIFSEEDLGACAEAPIYCLLLNPVTNDGRLRYKLTNRTDLGTIQAIAAHEAVHMIESYHDECYASKLTQLIGRILARSHRLTI
jgi:hypothetical protein